MKTKKITAVLIAIVTLQASHAEMIAQKPKSLDAVGSCHAGGSLTVVDVTKSSSSMSLARSQMNKLYDETFKNAIWGKSLNSESSFAYFGKPRLFKNGNQEILITTLCNPVQCNGSRRYVAIDMDSNAFGGVAYVYHGKQQYISSFGIGNDDDRFDREITNEVTRSYSASLNDALICAQTLDISNKTQ